MTRQEVNFCHTLRSYTVIRLVSIIVQANLLCFSISLLFGFEGAIDDEDRCKPLGFADFCLSSAVTHGSNEGRSALQPHRGGGRKHRCRCEDGESGESATKESRNVSVQSVRNGLGIGTGFAGSGGGDGL